MVPEQPDPRSKAAWRALALAQRRSPSQADLGEVLRRFLVANVPDGVVVGYDARSDELDIGGVLDELGDRAALTRTPSGTDDKTLTVHPWRSELEPHPFGYRQPVADAPIVPDEAIAAVLVPGLLFDAAGRRLGFGGGFYDRFLARLAPTVLRIGISNGRTVAELPADAHDVDMTHIASVSGVQAVTPRSPSCR